MKGGPGADLGSGHRWVPGSGTTRPSRKSSRREGSAGRVPRSSAQAWKLPPRPLAGRVAPRARPSAPFQKSRLDEEEEAPPDSSFLPWACLALPLRWGGRPHGQRGPRPELSTAPLRPSPFPRPGDPRPTFPLGLEKLRKQKTEKVFGSKSDILGHEYDKSPY